MSVMDAPAAVAAIMARVDELSSTPPAVQRLQSHFGVLLADQSTAIASASGDVASQTNASPATVRTVGTLAAPRITRGNFTPAAMPTGVWVDRIPNDRGKALAPAIAAAAQRNGLDPAFLAAVFWTESSYMPDVVSRTGAIGLGQLMPETAQWLGVDPWDPMQNIDGSARLYKYFLDSNNGDMSLAIASYAAGPNAVKRAGGIPDQFTANYVTKLLARTDYLAGRRSSPP